MGHKELNAQRLELYNQGRTDVQLALYYGVATRVIRQWRQRRGLPSNGKQGGANHKAKQHRTVSMQIKPKPILSYDRQFACYLSDKQLDANVKALVAEYGIKNSLVCRKASGLEIRQFGIRTSKYIDPYNQPPSCQS